MKGLVTIFSPIGATSGSRFSDATIRSTGIEGLASSASAAIEMTTYEIGRNIQLQSTVGLDARNDDWTLADLYADAPGEPADVRLEGVGADRVITGTIPPHGVLWVALDRR